jgi:hypothetical protein
MVMAGRYYFGAIGAEGSGTDPIVVAFEHPQFVACLRIPHDSCMVITGRYYFCAIGAEDTGRNFSFMPSKLF